MSWIGAVIQGGAGAAGGQANAEFLMNQGEFNAQVAEGEADYQVDKAAFEEIQLRKDVSRIIGQDVAISGKQMVAAGSQSNVDRLFQNITDSEIDALTIRHGGEVAATRLQTQAALDRFAGERGAAASQLVGTASAVGGVATAASSFDWNRNTGSRTLPSQLSGPSQTTDLQGRTVTVA